MSREDIQTNIRLPADLKESLTQEAKDNRRSLSAEIIDRLTKSFLPEGFVGAASNALGIDESKVGGWGGHLDPNQKKDEAIYGALVKVADVLSSSPRKAEDERDLLADVVRLMAKIRNGNYRAAGR